MRHSSPIFAKDIDVALADGLPYFDGQIICLSPKDSGRRVFSETEAVTACTVAPAVFSGSSGMMWGLRQSCASDLVGTRLLLSLWVVQITHSREALAWD